MGGTLPPPLLFEPIQLRELVIPHRLWVAPMCMYSAVEGLIQPWHLAHLGSFAIGRAGLVVTEATAVSPEGRISPDDAGIWTDEQAEAWRQVVDFLHSQQTPVAIQLAHAGRKASTRSPQVGRGYCPSDEGGWASVGPSAEAFGKLPAPRELSPAGIARVVADFVAAAKRAVAAAFDAIEIHGAHGYLLHSFLSPLSNHRSDDHGGDFTGRARFLLEVVDAVRAVIPDGMPLFVRISATDWVDGGWTADDAGQLATLLVERGTDLVSVSSGGNDHRQAVPPRPGYQVPLARAVREASGATIAAAGLITTPQQAETVLVDHAADVVLAARQFLREPGFALRAAAELGGHLEWAIPYQRGKFAGSIP